MLMEWCFQRQLVKGGEPNLQQVIILSLLLQEFGRLPS